MKNNGIFGKFVAMIMTFITVLSFASNVYALNLSEAEIKKLQEQTKSVPALELAITDLSLGVGDFIMEYLTFLLKEEVTVEKIIYNKVDALNANFFDDTLDSNQAPATQIIREMVNYWYDFLGKLVIVIYLITLVAVGIKTLLGGARRKSEGARIIYEMDNRHCDILFISVFNEVFV